VSAAIPAREAQGAVPVRPSHHHVDVWEVALGPCEGDAAARMLSDAEVRFAARLRVGAEAWVAARVALRRILGRYLGLAPSQVALETGANGKPRIAPGSRPDLRFNLSHSGDLALIAVRPGFEVGVDVEWRRSGVDGVAISRHMFGAHEHAALAALGAEASSERFFRSWVRREALAKATGRGIVSPPAPGDAARFTVRDLDDIPGFAAAVASEGDDWSVRRATVRHPHREATRSLASPAIGP
jgi:4'-phosphopantetheinyl transferase